MKKILNVKRIYLSFPMKGRDVEEYTRQARADQKFLESMGFAVLNPLDNGLPSEVPVTHHMRVDYTMVVSCDAIYMCKGWEYSHGCMNELQVAADCGLAVITCDDMLSTDLPSRCANFADELERYLKEKVGR